MPNGLFSDLLKRTLGGRGLREWAEFIGTEGPAAWYREKYGIPGMPAEFGEEVAELRRVAAEGLDPLQFRRQMASRAGALTGTVTQRMAGGLERLGTAYGGAISAGLTERYRAEAAGAKVRGFGDILFQMMSQDEATRQTAKEQLLNMLLTQQQLDTQLILHEQMIRAQLGRD